jgi:hypothetical protein
MARLSILLPYPPHQLGLRLAVRRVQSRLRPLGVMAAQAMSSVPVGDDRAPYFANRQLVHGPQAPAMYAECSQFVRWRKQYRQQVAKKGCFSSLTRKRTECRRNDGRGMVRRSGKSLLLSAMPAGRENSRPAVHSGQATGGFARGLPLGYVWMPLPARAAGLFIPTLPAGWYTFKGSACATGHYRDDAATDCR